MILRYAANHASLEHVRNHLQACGDCFLPPLGQRVALGEYCGRIMAKAVRFEAWDGVMLVGLVAVYFNDPRRERAFVTSVSTLSAYMRRGVATELMRRAIDHARRKGFTVLDLEVGRGNARAHALYKKLGFIQCNEQRGAVWMRLAIAAAAGK